MSELTAGGIVLAGYGWHLVVGRPYPEPVRDVPGLTHQGRTQLVLVIPCDDEHAPRLFDRELPMYLDLGVATAGPGVPVLLLRVGIAADRPGQELRTVFDAPLTWHIGDAAPPLSVDAVDDLWIVTVLEGGPRRSPSYMRQLTVRRILPVIPEPTFVRRLGERLEEQFAHGPASHAETERAVENYYRRYPRPWQAWREGQS